jgi:hypothetical protein
MEDGGAVKSIKKKSFTIEGHIGYDVNGSHNGVWLPGNYAIKTALPRRRIKGKVYPARVGTTPVKGKSWEELSEDGYDPWQFAYVAGACKAAKGQFHDSHEKPYSETVKEHLGKIVIALATHLDTECPHCKGKTKLPPPFRVKLRLRQASVKLRGFVQGSPGKWKRPWFTSEKWAQKFFSGGKITKDFRKAYSAAELVPPDRTAGDEDD